MMPETQGNGSNAQESTGAPQGTDAPGARARRAFQGVRGVPRQVEQSIERAGDALWRVFKKQPTIGVGVATLVGLGMATLVGASELAVGLAAGVAAYHVLKKHEPPSKALEEMARFHA
jgi:hypothetical protein